MRDRWPRVDTFFHRVTCGGIKIPHPRFYRHRRMSRRMFRRRGKSVLPYDAERTVCCLARKYKERAREKETKISLFCTFQYSEARDYIRAKIHQNLFVEIHIDRRDDTFNILNILLSHLITPSPFRYRVVIVVTPQIPCAHNFRESANNKKRKKKKEKFVTGDWQSLRRDALKFFDVLMAFSPETMFEKFKQAVI